MSELAVVKYRIKWRKILAFVSISNVLYSSPSPTVVRPALLQRMRLAPPTTLMSSGTLGLIGVLLLGIITKDSNAGHPVELVDNIEPIALYNAMMRASIDEVACPPPPSPLHG
jgi:hypothetical protein